MNERSRKSRLFFPPEAWALLAAVALLAMEVTVLSLWYRVFFYTTRAEPGRIALVLAGLLAGSYLLAHVLNRSIRSGPVQKGSLALWLLLAAFGSLRLLLYAKIAVTLPELLGQPARFIVTAGADGAGFFHLLASAALIWYGVRLASGPLSLLSTQVTFQIGLVWMLLYGMAFAPSRPVEATAGLYGFLFFGLIAMSAARVTGLTELRGGRLPRFGPVWLGGIALAALIVVGLSVALGWVAGTQIVAVVVRGFLFLLTAITGLVLMIFTPLLYFLAGLLVRLIEVIREVLVRISTLQMPRFVQNIANEITEIIDAIIPVVLAARGLTLLVILLAVIVVVLLALRLRRHRDAMTLEEDTSPSQAEPSGSLLRRLLARLADSGRRMRLRTPGQIIAAARIRQIYRQLMTLSQKLGQPRPPSITPLEYVPRLAALFPENHAELDEITGAYVRVRYGEYPETMAEVDSVQSAWERVKKQGRRMMAKRIKSK